MGYFFATNSPMEKSISIRIFNCINKLQQVNRFISINLLDLNISRLEMFLLVELEAVPTRGISDFATLFQLDRSTISRCLSGLIEKKLLTEEQETGSRLKKFAITVIGKKVIKEIDLQANSILSTKEKLVGQNKIKLVIELFNLLSEGLNEPAAIARKHDPEFRVSQRRLTRAFKLLSDTAYDSKLSHLAFHTLLLISTLKESSATDISKKLNANKAAVSATIKKLLKEELVESISNPIDKRASILSTTKIGLTLLNDIEKKVCKLIEKALKNIDQKRVLLLVDAFEEFVEIKTKKQEISLKIFSSISEKSKARSFFIKELVAQKKENNCPTQIFPSNKVCLAYIKDNTLIGVSQINKKNNLEDFSIFTSGVNQKVIVEIRSKALFSLSSKHVSKT